MGRSRSESSTGVDAVVDVVVVGAGLAGLATALHLQGADVLLLSDTSLGTGGASRYAKGGIAAAVAVPDSPADHARDTLAVGAGANDAAVVALLTASAPAAVDWLDRLGTDFERGDDGWSLGREAGHRHDRILHAGGDATGVALVDALASAAAAADHVTVWERTRADSLLVDDGRVVGVLARDADGRPLVVGAGAVVLATGGAAGAWQHTTNPPTSRGAGLVLAADAGAALADLEYVQFHPTALATGTDPLPLLTEALRGAGALIVDRAGHRFLQSAHVDAELAPRDVVARAIFGQLAAGHEVLMDLRPVRDLADRFPSAVRACRAAGFDPLSQPVPMIPAAHYHMGGVATDDRGRTSLPGLFACGEVARTGAHGASRLASNSLLEAAVFAGRVATAATGHDRPGSGRVRAAVAALDTTSTVAPDPSAVAEVRALLSRYVGVLRDAAGLQAAIERLDDLVAPRRGGAVAAVARMIAMSAAAHQESRGAHTRTDLPATLPTVPRVTLTAANRGRPDVRVDHGVPAGTAVAVGA